MTTEVSQSDDGRPQRGDAAKLALIETAEMLIAEHGLFGPSLREISSSAKQANNYAVQYHFDSREGLVEAVFEHRMTPINARRMELLEQAGPKGQTPTLRSLVEALVIPFAETIGDRKHPTYYARFASLVAFDPSVDFFVNYLHQPYLEGWRRLVHGLLVLQADVPEDLAVSRTHLVHRMVTTALADQERFATVAGRKPWPFMSTDNLIECCIAVLTAPQA